MSQANQNRNIQTPVILSLNQVQVGSDIITDKTQIKRVLGEIIFDNPNELLEMREFGETQPVPEKTLANSAPHGQIAKEESENFERGSDSVLEYISKRKELPISSEECESEDTDEETEEEDEEDNWETLTTKQILAIAGLGILAAVLLGVVIGQIIVWKAGW